MTTSIKTRAALTNRYGYGQCEYIIHKQYSNDYIGEVRNNYFLLKFDYNGEVEYCDIISRPFGEHYLSKGNACDIDSVIEGIILKTLIEG